VVGPDGVFRSDAVHLELNWLRENGPITIHGHAIYSDIFHPTVYRETDVTVSISWIGNFDPYAPQPNIGNLIQSAIDTQIIAHEAT